MRILAGLFLLCGLSAIAQPVGVGIKAGAPLTEALRARGFPTATLLPFTASSSNFTVGPYLEIRLPGKLSIEADALFRRYSLTNGPTSATTHTLEFPVVIKKKLLSGPIKPYLEGGVSFSRLSDIPQFSPKNLNSYGLVAGAGIQFNLLLMKISPEVRYTGWTLKHFDALAESQRNQVALLVGFGF